MNIDYGGVLAADLGPELPAGMTLRLAGWPMFEISEGQIVRILDES